MRYKNHNTPPSNLAIAAAAIGEDKYALELVAEAIETLDPYLPCKGMKESTSKALRMVNGFDEIVNRLGFLVDKK